jgi:phosphatidate cytidylyltransferase
MTLTATEATLLLVIGVMCALAVATLVGQILKHRQDTGLNAAAVQAFNARIQAWWLLSATLAATFLIGKSATVVLFGLVSFWALREFITLTPTRAADHRALFWVFFLFTPLQYVLVGMGNAQYGLFSILIPVYGFLFIPARIALAGDYRRFLERTAKIQTGLVICVYCLSHAPALLNLETGDASQNASKNASLLFFFVIVDQMSDMMQFISERLIGRRVIAPAINANKTWEGLIGGVLAATLLGTLLWWATPFAPWEAAAMSLVIGVMGFCGSLTMSAIKRDRGVSDYGTLVVGHSGVLDRLDSLCFAAPVFFHLTRAFFT